MSSIPRDERAGPGEEYNPGPPTQPRQAATVILLREGEGEGGGGLEVLLVQRTPHARFMGGVWVFPGGAVEHDEGEDDSAHRAAALRELSEEAGVTLADPRELVKFSRWVTPAEVSIRFDTHFFLAEIPAGQEPRVDGEECVAHGWYTPPSALAAYREGAIELVFPTIKHLEQLSAFTSVAELIAHARERKVEPVQPRIVLLGEVARVVLPGEDGY